MVRVESMVVIVHAGLIINRGIMIHNRAILLLHPIYFSRIAHISYTVTLLALDSRSPLSILDAHAHG